MPSHHRSGGIKVDRIRLDSNVTDLTQVKDLPIKSLWLDFQPARDAALLRAMPTLEYINDKPVAEFWKGVDADGK